MRPLNCRPLSKKRQQQRAPPKIAPSLRASMVIATARLGIHPVLSPLRLAPVPMTYTLYWRSRFCYGDDGIKQGSLQIGGYRRLTRGDFCLCPH